MNDSEWYKVTKFDNIFYVTMLFSTVWQTIMVAGLFPTEADWLNWTCLIINALVLVTRINKQNVMPMLHTPARREFDRQQAAKALAAATPSRDSRIATLTGEIERLDKLIESTNKLAIEHRAIEGLTHSADALTAAAAGNIVSRDEAAEELATLTAERDAELQADRDKAKADKAARKALRATEERVFDSLGKLPKAIRNFEETERREELNRRSIKPPDWALAAQNHLCTRCGAEGDVMVKKDDSGAAVLRHTVACWSCGREREMQAPGQVWRGSKKSSEVVRRKRVTTRVPDLDEEDSKTRQARYKVEREIMLAGMRKAHPEDYQKWLTRYVADGGRVEKHSTRTFAEDNDFITHWYVVTDPSMTIFPGYGSSAMNIIVPAHMKPKIMRSRTGCVGHSRLFITSPTPKVLSFHGRINEDVVQFPDTKPDRANTHPARIDFDLAIERARRNIGGIHGVPDAHYKRELRRRESFTTDVELNNMIRKMEDEWDRIDRKYRGR